MQWRLCAALVTSVACGPEKYQPPASGSGSAVAPPPADARAAREPCVARGIAAYIVDGPRVTFCRAASDTRREACLEIDSRGRARVPETSPPLPLPAANEVHAPHGFSAKPVRDANQRLIAVDVCEGDRCNRVPLAHSGQPGIDDSVSSIAVARDGTRVAVDYGDITAGKTHAELHRVSPPKLIAELSIPGMACTQVLRFVDDRLALNGFKECGRPTRDATIALASNDGKLLVDLRTGHAAFRADDWRHLHGPRWLVHGANGIEVWDVAAVKRVATLPDVMLRFGVTEDDVIITLDNDGTVMRYDADLKLIGTNKLALCADD